MRATLDWSYELLDEPRRTLFRRLSVFSGGFSLEAAEDVGSDDGGEEAMNLLADLIDHSLVTVSRGSDAVRYGMLEPVRQYALERLEESGEEESARLCHAAHFHALACEAGSRLMEAEQVHWFERLGRDRYNLLSAVRFLLDGGDLERAVGLKWSLWRFWWIAGLIRESRDFMAEVVGQSGLSDERRSEAALVVGTMSWSMGEPETSLPALEIALEFSRRTKDPRSQAIALMGLGYLDAESGKYAQAREHFGEGLGLFREAGEKWGEALMLNYLGIPDLIEGDHESARIHFEEGLAAAREAGDLVAAHQALLNLGRLALDCEDREKAADHLAEGLSIASDLRDVLNAVHFVKGLGHVAALRGENVRAVKLLGASEAAFRATGSSPYRYVSDEEFHTRILNESREELGIAAFEEAWSIGAAMGLREAVAEALRPAG